MWWIVPITFVGATVTYTAATIAPQTELFLKFACDELRPEHRVHANLARWRPGPNTIQTNVSLTFIQRNPILDDRIMKPTLLHPDKRCSQDPDVHRAAAKLSAGITSTEGILSCLTLGWWSQYSDRAGRKIVLALSAFAMLIADLVLLLVAFKAEMLPGGYRILILGFSASVAAGHAYIADCSSPSARFWIGCVFAGGALGLSLGSLLNSYSSDLLSVSYISTTIQVIYVVFMAFIVPESLSNKARATARELYETDTKHCPRTLFGFVLGLMVFVRPLGIFLPRQLSSGHWRSTDRDWNLTLIGVAATAVAINVGSYGFKYQYAIKTFNWNSVQLGYWLSLVGFCRAVYLSTILPIILKLFYAREEQQSNSANNDGEKEAQVRKIDLLVARSSLLIDIVGYTIVGIVTSRAPFIGATIVLAFGGGFSPSIQSLALALSNPSAHIARREARAHRASIPSDAKQEIGRLFGAFTIIHSLGGQVVGPALFSAVFGTTIGSYPKAFFWLSAFIVAVALGALGAVRLDVPDAAKDPGCV